MVKLLITSVNNAHIFSKLPICKSTNWPFSILLIKILYHHRW